MKLSVSNEFEKARHFGRQEERALIVRVLHKAFSGLTAALFATDSARESLKTGGAPEAEILSKVHKLLTKALAIRDAS
jgi:hypothetical protein